MIISASAKRNCHKAHVVGKHNTMGHILSDTDFFFTGQIKTFPPFRDI